jgi:membrane associated rhomboid family serine protease
MITLFSLGPVLVRRMGSNRFNALYILSLLGGALGFAALSSETAPMIGASGALFGLAGALLGYETSERLARGTSIWPIGQTLLWLVLLNLVLWWAMNGQLAWQTHLGGFIAGWLFSLWPAKVRH